MCHISSLNFHGCVTLGNQRAVQPRFPDEKIGQITVILVGFVGADYVYSDRWTYSLLYNRASAKDFRYTNTIYEGIELNTLSATASYYFMRNAKGIIEVNVDFQPKDNDPNFVGHETKENYLMVGFDVAF